MKRKVISGIMLILFLASMLIFMLSIQLAKTEGVPPGVSFAYSPSNPVVNQTVTFNASNSDDPDGYIVSYNWDFGDGNKTTTSDPIITHKYIAEGTYNVSLTVVDNDGLGSPRMIIPVTVIPEFPSAIILPLFMIATLLAAVIYRRKHTM